MSRAVLAALVALPVLIAATGCQESVDDRRDAYCEQVKKDAPTLSRITHEGGAGAFLEALPVLEGLGRKAPRDLKDEWKVLLDSLHVMEDTVDETGVDPDRIEDRKLPRDLSRADRRTLRNAAAGLRSPEVTQAVQGIEQQAIDVCKQPLV